MKKQTFFAYLSVLFVSIGLSAGSAMVADAAQSAAAANAVAAGSAQSTATVNASATDSNSAFPRVTPRWRKWELGIMDSYAQQKGWKALGKDQLRLVAQAAGGVDSAFEVDLQTGKATFWGGTHGSQKPVSFTLQKIELGNLHKLLESQTFRDLSQENQATGTDGSAMLLESDWQDAYRWWLYWGDIPSALREVEALLQTGLQRQQNR